MEREISMKSWNFSGMLKFMTVKKQSTLFHCLLLMFDSIILLVKKNFYRLALKYHPDRVSGDKKEEASAKFNIIHNAYTILSDLEKKKSYDEGTDVLFTKTSIASQWEHYLKPVANNDIEMARQAYQGSEREELDLIREIKIGNGSMTHLLNTIPFMRTEDENRIIESIQNLMSLGKITKMSIKKLPKK